MKSRSQIKNTIMKNIFISLTPCLNKSIYKNLEKKYKYQKID